MVLSVQSLNKMYGNQPALNNFSMSVDEGNVLGILGPNGSGKTTLLSILVGLRKANSGSFSWFNSPNNQVCNNRIGALIESPYLYPYLSVADNLKITALAKSVPTQNVDEALQMVDLLQKRDAKCMTLSLGMKQRLAVAQALIGNPQVLVLDEPTNGLDPVGIADIRSIIKHQAQEGRTVIVASHNLDEIQKICSHVVILKQGSNIASGKVDQLLKLKQVVTIDTQYPNQAQEALSQLPNIKTVEISQNSLTISMESTNDLTAINEVLASNKIIMTGLAVRQPSLEELFIDIVKQN